MSSEKNKIVLKKIKDSTHILHPDSGLVLKSSKERTVIGRYVDNKILPANRETIELAEKFGFKHENNVQSEEEADGDRDEEGEDSEEDEEQTGEGEEDAGSNDEKDENNNPEAVVHEKTSEPSSNDTTLKSEEVMILFNNEISKLHNILLNSFVLVEKDYRNTISGLNETIETKTQDYIDLKDKYDKLHQKFEGIKSLFS